MERGRGQPRGVREALDEVQERVHVVERCVGLGRDAVLPELDEPDLRDLGGDLRRGEDAAEPRFGALRQLDLDGADRGGRDVREEALHVAAHLLGGAAEVPGADLPN